MDAPIFFDRCSNPIDMGRWMDLSHDMDYKRVRWAQVGSWEVSTVWLGIDHAIIGPPLIFETMVFERAESNGYMGPAFGLEGGSYVYHESFDEFTASWGQTPGFPTAKARCWYGVTRSSVGRSRT
jgi:hypothetical protein